MEVILFKVLAGEEPDGKTNGEVFCFLYLLSRIDASFDLFVFHFFLFSPLSMTVKIDRHY